MLQLLWQTNVFYCFLQQGEPLCCHGDSVVDLDPCLGKFGDCLLFKKLIDLANPLHFQVVKHIMFCHNVTFQYSVISASIDRECVSTIDIINYDYY